MSRADRQIASEIVAALQERIAGWTAERAKLEGRVTRQQRMQQRYDALGELIAAAQTQIASAQAKTAGNGQ